MLNKFTIYGERCRGTTYLEQIVKTNFNAEITWKYGWKHFFINQNLSNSDDTLFICIVRNPYDWINSFFKCQYNLPSEFKNKFNFFNKEIYSIYKDGSEIPNERYSNVFELRHLKLKFLSETLPLQVKNYIFIKHENLLNDFNGVMDSIKNKGLVPKNEIYLNNLNYKCVDGNKLFAKTKKRNFNFKWIDNKFNPYFEKKINYF